MEYLEMHRVSQDFYHGKERLSQVLEEVNLIGQRGEIIGIIGEKPNARDALFHILGGLCAPKTGCFFLNNEPFPYDSDILLARYRNANVGIVSLQYPLREKWSVMENVSLPYLFSDKFAQKNIRNACSRALTMVGMQMCLDREVWSMTLGEKVRIMMARALVNRPKLLVCGDLLEGLNHFQARKIMESIETFPEAGITTIIVTDDEEILKCCTRDLLLKDGKLVEM